MAGYRIPGSWGINPEIRDMNDGTSARTLSPRPGPVDTATTAPAGGAGPYAPSRIATSSHRASAEARLQMLRQGSNGESVQRLQRQLNARLQPSPKLAIDGAFGPVTHQAVLRYQKGVSVMADGVVGKDTWYHLLKGETSSGGSAAGHRSSAIPAAPAVWEWPLQDKFAEALRRTAPKVPGSMRNAFEALLTPESLAIMAATLVAWAASHAFGVGEVVDILLVIGAVVFLGVSAFDVASELGDFLVMTSVAANEHDLDEAAGHLASAIAIIGVVAFAALLTKLARSRGGKAVKETPAETPPPKSQKTSLKAQSPSQAGAADVGTSQNPTAELLAKKPLPPLRQQYVDAVSALAERASSMQAKGASEEQIARALHAERRMLGEKFKDLTPPDRLAEIYARNVREYGDKFGPSIEWLRAKGKSWEQIIKSASRTGGKDLGF